MVGAHAHSTPKTGLGPRALPHFCVVGLVGSACCPLQPGAAPPRARSAPGTVNPLSLATTHCREAGRRGGGRGGAVGTQGRLSQHPTTAAYLPGGKAAA